jgi:hypothetical protein
MAYTFEELKHKTVAEMREIAATSKHEALQGYTQLNKEHLLVALCKAFHIDMFVHHHVEGIDKAAIKVQIRELKKYRDMALAQHDHKQLKSMRRKIHRLKRGLHKATV